MSYRLKTDVLFFFTRFAFFYHFAFLKKLEQINSSKILLFSSVFFRRQSLKSSASNRLTSLIEKTREICENPTSQKSQKKRKVLTKRSPKKRQRSDSASSSEDEAHAEVFHPSSRHSRQGHNPVNISPKDSFTHSSPKTKMHAKAKHQRIRSDPELPRNSTTPVLRPEPCANESRIDSDRGGSSSDGIPDLSQNAMRKRVHPIKNKLPLKSQ